MSKILIRVDGNISLATGNIFRMLTIAEELISHNIDVRFVVADTISSKLLIDFISLSTPSNYYLSNSINDNSIICLHSKYDDLSIEINNFLDIINDQSPDCIIIDTPYLNNFYIDSIRSKYPHITLIYFDDLMLEDYHTDIIINYDINVNTNLYKSSTKVLAGTEYAPLRSQFSHTDYSISSQVENVLISTGGSDNNNIAGNLLKNIMSSNNTDLSNLAYHVIMGRINVNSQSLVDLASTYNNINLHSNVTDMAGLMKSCDIAITAGGTTLYELSAIGVPTICFSIADNQIEGSTGFADKESVIYIGDIRNHSTHIELIANALNLLIKDFELRHRLSSNMKHLIDGQGTSRIVNTILKYIKPR